MDISIFLWITNGLLIILAYVLKMEHQNIKESHKDLNARFDKSKDDVKDQYFKKQDFTSFEDRLWARLDRMFDDVKHEIQEIKK